MIIKMNKPTLYDLNVYVKKGTLLIGASTEHGITEGRIYVATKNQGDGTFHDCIFVINDEGKEQDYSSEWFGLYEGEKVICE